MDRKASRYHFCA